MCSVGLRGLGFTGDVLRMQAFAQRSGDRRRGAAAYLLAQDDSSSKLLIMLQVLLSGRVVEECEN